MKSYSGFFNLAHGAAGTPFFFLADPKTYSMLSMNIIAGWNCLARKNVEYNILPIEALSLSFYFISSVVGVKSKSIALHSYANALIASVLPAPVGPKNKKYDYLSSFSFKNGDPNCIPIDSAIAVLNYA